jgi:3-hydroxyisobutyrate dehydrogenase-like beta-hydroxyacid dehydrogenase
MIGISHSGSHMQIGVIGLGGTGGDISRLMRHEAVVYDRGAKVVEVLRRDGGGHVEPKPGKAEPS